MAKPTFRIDGEESIPGYSPKFKVGDMVTFIENSILFGKQTITGVVTAVESGDGLFWDAYAISGTNGAKYFKSERSLVETKGALKYSRR